MCFAFYFWFPIAQYLHSSVTDGHCVISKVTCLCTFFLVFVFITVKISFLTANYSSILILFCSRVCGNVHGLVRKYNIMCCRQCFRIYSKDIGFVKVNSRENSKIPWYFVLFREIISTIWAVIEVLSPMIYANWVIIYMVISSLFLFWGWNFRGTYGSKKKLQCISELFHVIYYHPL